MAVEYSDFRHGLEKVFNAFGRHLQDAQADVYHEVLGKYFDSFGWRRSVAWAQFLAVHCEGARHHPSIRRALGKDAVIAHDARHLQRMLDCMVALEAVEKRHDLFYRLKGSAREDSFLIGYGAMLTEAVPIAPFPMSVSERTSLAVWNAFSKRRISGPRLE